MKQERVILTSFDNILINWGAGRTIQKIPHTWQTFPRWTAIPWLSVFNINKGYSVVQHDQFSSIIYNFFILVSIDHLRYLTRITRRQLDLSAPSQYVHILVLDCIARFVYILSLKVCYEFLEIRRISYKCPVYRPFVWLLTYSLTTLESGKTTEWKVEILWPLGFIYKHFITYSITHNIHFSWRTELWIRCRPQQQSLSRLAFVSALFL